MNPVIEGFRGLAALMVLAHHYSFRIDDSIAGGRWHFFHNGVDLFFVITGFLFAPYLLGEARQPPCAFAIRRFFRLYPLYLLSLLTAVLLFWAQKAGMATAVVKHLAFVQALPVFPLAEAGYFSLVYWTLPVEVMFYALVALVMALDRRAGAPASHGDRRLLRWGLVAWSAFLLTYYVGHAPSDARWVLWQAQLPALLPAFWLGMLLHRWRGRFAARASWRFAALLAGAGMSYVLFATYPDVARTALTARPFGWFNVASALAYALLLAAALGFADGLGAGPAGENGAAGPLARLAAWGGALSYGIYLFHEWTMLLVERILAGWSPLLQVLLALIAVIVIATFLHWLAEAPLRAYGRRLSERQTDA